MGTLVLAARILLAVVFATAGTAKLVDRKGSQRALQDFGLPPVALPPLAVLLPLAELAAAAALLPAPSARWGALVALGLLLAFIAGISRALVQGEAPDCHCFGQIHSAPAGRSTLARNAALAAVAALVVFEGPGPTIDGWIAARTAAELTAVGAGISAVVAATVAVRLWLENRSLRAKLAVAQAGRTPERAGLPIGTQAPTFALRDLEAETVTLESLLARGKPLALIFVDTGCGSCQQLLPRLGGWQASLANSLTVTVLSSGAAADNLPLMEEHGIAGVLLQESAEVLRAYGLDGTPSAVIVGPDGTIASEPGEGVFTIEPLIRLTLQRGTTPAPEPAGRSFSPQPQG